MTDLFDDDAVRKRAALALSAPVAERGAGASESRSTSHENRGGAQNHEPAPVGASRREGAVQAPSEQGAPSEAVGRRSVPLTFGARQSPTAAHQLPGSAATMHVEVPLHTASGVVMVDPRKLRMQDHRDNGRAIFRALCMARACPSCGTRHVAFKCTPPEALCLTCSIAEQARQEAKARDRAPALPGL